MLRQDENITLQLNNVEKTSDAENALFKQIYCHLREIAFVRLQSEKHNSTYSVTALVDEAYFRLTSDNNYRWENRRQFYAATANTMKRILIENARHNAKKGRNNKFNAFEFDEEIYLDNDTSKQIINLNDALEQLTAKRPELAEIVQLKFFVGLEIGEIAEVLECSKRSVDRKWSLARAWLATTLTDEIS